MAANTNLTSPAPLWPHGDAALLHLVRRASQRATACWTATVSTGLSAVQYAILVVLEEMGTCDQQTLGARASFDKATGTYLIERMCKSGLIEVQTDIENRRRKLVTMTDEGRMMLKRMMDEAIQAEAMIASQMEPEDIAAIKLLLEKLTCPDSPQEQQ